LRVLSLFKSGRKRRRSPSRRPSLLLHHPRRKMPRQRRVPRQRRAKQPLEMLLGLHQLMVRQMERLVRTHLLRDKKMQLRCHPRKKSKSSRSKCEKGKTIQTSNSRPAPSHSPLLSSAISKTRKSTCSIRIWKY
jgi:hypothetical protein